MSIQSSTADRTAAEAYERFLLPYIFQPWAERAVKWAAPAPGEHVLDVACGTGVGARIAAPAIGRSGKVIGLDVDAGMLATAQERLRDLDVSTEWHCASALCRWLVRLVSLSPRASILSGPHERID